jgi:hypothetical protein
MDGWMEGRTDGWVDGKIIGQWRDDLVRSVSYMNDRHV